MILSANILNLLCRQYAHETANSLFYTALQSWADMRGLDGTASFFHDQANGERAHADMVLDYIHDRNEQLRIDPIDTSAVTAPGTYIGLFVSAQERERATSEAIAEIRGQAQVERDMMTCAWLDGPGGLVLEQLEEEATISSILDRINARSGNVDLVSGDIVQAEMPGNVIHDIDCWLKARV